MSQSRIHDLSLLLGAMLAIPACVDRPTDPGDDGASPEDQAALDDALDVCRPYGRKVEACYTADAPEGYGYGNTYVAMVGSCVAQVGYYAAESPACASALSDYFACITALDCEELFADVGTAEDGIDEAEVPCGEHEEALDDACGWSEDVDSAPENDSG